VTSDERTAARARCEAAAPAEVEWDGDETGIYDDTGRKIIMAMFDDDSTPVELVRATCSFFAHARCDLPRALTEIDRLEALLRRHGIDPTETPTQET
jgi:hypothetical protein